MHRRGAPNVCNRPVADILPFYDDRGMRDDNLSWLASWYLAECNDDWEHSYGVKIATLHNPGWTVVLDLKETNLKGRVSTLMANDDRHRAEARRSRETALGQGSARSRRA